MSSLSDFLRRQQHRWYGRNIDRIHHMRRKYAAYVAKFGFEIGDYSVGEPRILFYEDATRLRVGKYSSLAADATLVLGGNHHSKRITTYPLRRLFGAGETDDDHASRGDLVIGSDVWVASGALILSGVTIGDGAVIGAGAVVLHDVPPYSIAFGNPARVMSKRFSDDVIDQLLQLRWWDLPPDQVKLLRPLLTSNRVDAFIDACRAYRGRPPRGAGEGQQMSVTSGSKDMPDESTAQPNTTTATAGPVDSAALDASDIIALVARDGLSSLSAAELDQSLDRLGIDSFAMLTIRTAIEEALHAQITDAAWSAVDSLRDIREIYRSIEKQGTRDAKAEPAHKLGGISVPDDAPLWAPDPQRVAASQVVSFMKDVNRHHGTAMSTYRELHAWSVANPEGFWDTLWNFAGVIGEKGARCAVDMDLMPGARFFPDAKLNFAENLLRRSDGEAIVFRSETGESTRMTWAQLRALVSRMQQALAAAGVTPGDRVAAMLPNLPETVALMLAVTSLGAIWSSCSPDFGERGVVDRFRQIAPKVFVGVDGYRNNGKTVRMADKLAAIAAALSPACVVIVHHFGEIDATPAAVPQSTALGSFLAPFVSRPLEFERFPFDHPAFIVFSSGTTGAPKCIIHGAGGTLLQHLKEHRLQCDVRAGDRIFYQTTCGWMMWNWLVSALASGATLILYDGATFVPTAAALWEYAAKERVTLFGTSAKYIEGCRRAGIRPMTTCDLSALRLIASTGSPLSAENFKYTYSAVKKDVQLASISGGTDILSCFVLGDPTAPVWAGEIQAPGLGMAVEVRDEVGRTLPSGTGELVCTRPFVSMPLGFWNDSDGSRYRAAYFERYPGEWHHGDFAEWTPHGGLVIHGRSDATLNPGGVRFGTAEIYAAVESIPEVSDAICIGQDWDDDVRVVLFVQLTPGCQLDGALRERIRDAIRSATTAAHVPAKIIQVAEIPRTRSGKLSEIAVRNMVHGLPVKNTDALANPDALSCYKDIAELKV